MAKASCRRLQLPAKDEKIAQVGDQDAQNGFPSEMGQHERRVPFPGRRHHEYRRRRIAGQGAAHGNVDEQ